MKSEQLRTPPEATALRPKYQAWIAPGLALLTLVLAAVRVVMLLLEGNAKDALDERTLAAPLVAGLLLQLPRMKTFKGFGVEAELVEEVTKKVTENIKPELEASVNETKRIVNNKLNNADRPAADDEMDEDLGVDEAEGGSGATGVRKPQARKPASLSKPSQDLPRPSDGESADASDWAKGRFGGLSTVGNRRLSARGTPSSDSEWLDLTITVESTTEGNPLKGRVLFFVHDSFPTFRYERTADKGGRATLRLRSYGAFTVGAMCIDEEGTPTMELDLAQALPDAPKWFLER